MGNAQKTVSEAFVSRLDRQKKKKKKKKKEEGPDMSGPFCL